MRKHKWMITMVIASFMMISQVSYAQDNLNVMSVVEDYIDTKSLVLPYQYIPNFFVAPIQIQGELLSRFNQSREGYIHEGVDIRVPEGTPIFAIADGKVTKAAPDSKGVEKGGGKMIFLDCGNGIEGRYMHLSLYGVKVGDYVKAGQVIGFSGNTGDSTTPHLHFELRVGNVPIDSEYIFRCSNVLLGSETSKESDNILNNNYLMSNDSLISGTLQTSGYLQSSNTLINNVTTVENSLVKPNTYEEISSFFSVQE